MGCWLRDWMCICVSGLGEFPESRAQVSGAPGKRQVGPGPGLAGLFLGKAVSVLPAGCGSLGNLEYPSCPGWNGYGMWGT